MRRKARTLSRPSGESCAVSTAASIPLVMSSLRRRASWVRRATSTGRRSIGGQEKARANASASVGPAGSRSHAITSRPPARWKYAAAQPVVVGSGDGGHHRLRRLKDAATRAVASLEPQDPRVGMLAAEVVDVLRSGAAPPSYGLVPVGGGRHVAVLLAEKPQQHPLGE